MTDKLEMTDQARQPDTSERKTQPISSGKGVFIRRAPGMPFEEFKKFCIQRFREVGLIKDPAEPPPHKS